MFISTPDLPLDSTVNLDPGNGNKPQWIRGFANEQRPPPRVTPSAHPHRVDEQLPTVERLHAAPSHQKRTQSHD